MPKIAKLVFAAHAAALVGTPACVPETAEIAPRGAVALTLVPSAATRGEAFLTSDGWTVTIERLAILAHVGCIDSPDRLYWLFEPSRSPEIVIRAAREGAAWVVLDLPAFRSVDVPPVVRIDASPDIVARFQLAADGKQQTAACRPKAFDPSCEVNGPTLYLAARGDKGARAVRTELALVPSVRLAPTHAAVRANAITPSATTLYGEALFTNETGRVVFEDLARADADGDDILRYAELKAAIDPAYPRPEQFVPPDPDDDFAPPGSIAATLESRARRLLPVTD